MPRAPKSPRPSNEELCAAFAELIQTAGRREILAAFEEIESRLCPRPPAEPGRDDDARRRDTVLPEPERADIWDI